jgi:hypothetical protein
VTRTCWPTRRGAPTELNGLAVGKQTFIANGSAHLRIGLQCGDGAVDIELGVGAGVAAVGHGEADEFVAVLLEQGRRLLHQFAALLEGEGAQGGAAHAPRVMQGLLAVEAIRRRHGQDFLGGWIEQGLARALALPPFPGEVALQCGHVVLVKISSPTSGSS